MDTQLLQELKDCELDMLKAFIAICEKLNLKYYCIDGTLLGAVRHKGFIPWDDDVDLAMPRADYDKFVAEAQKFLPEYYFLQTHRTDPEWPANFAKIRDSRTTFIESSVKNQKINHGAYIDIFPLDIYPDKKIANKWFNIRERLIKKRIFEVFTVEVPQLKGLIKVKSSIMAAIARTLYPTLGRALDCREKMLKSFRSGSLLANHCDDSVIVPCDWYGDGTEFEFEGLKVRGPSEYDLWLTHVYGDYMQLPPEDKRITHHYTEVIDLHKPYGEYVS